MVCETPTELMGIGVPERASCPRQPPVAELKIHQMVNAVADAVKAIGQDKRGWARDDEVARPDESQVVLAVYSLLI